jgi:hypothetical protein
MPVPVAAQAQLDRAGTGVSLSWTNNRPAETLILAGRRQLLFKAYVFDGPPVPAAVISTVVDRFSGGGRGASQAAEKLCLLGKIGENSRRG